jgi:SAM-dependent methyltransferase
MNQLLGHDLQTQVFDDGERILRRINSSSYKSLEDLFSLYRKLDLCAMGFVETTYDNFNKCFSHQKHLISYPYEWPAEMFKDACIFHLKLLLKLEKHHLTLKDAIPSNILFNYNEPVFVDFPSLVKNEDLQYEMWLVEKSTFDDPRIEVINKMFVPFMVIPLIALANKLHSKSRELLRLRACNMNNTQPTLLESFLEKNFFLFRYLKLIPQVLKYYRTNKIIYSYNRTPFREYIDEMILYIESLDVSPSSGTYLKYYSSKNEDYDYSNQGNWAQKQKSVSEVLNSLKPKLVIDIGANTGWYSFLAEYLGAKVIAFEIEEDCLSSIYQKAKKEKKNILSLKISFDDLLKEYYAHNNSTTPLFQSPVNRFHADLVMCLGLIHHLVLGLGHSLEHVFEVLSKLSKNSILIEFISLDDKLIVSEPTFFKNIHLYSKDNYNLNILTKTGAKFFEKYEILKSHPDSRTLVLFTKKL